jgi:hypothetical protein
MAAFSEENFGNEGAVDYLSMLIARLMSTINEIVTHPDRLDLDEDGESMFMPSIEVLALLCERYGGAPPRPATVKQWHNRYLQVYDRSIDKQEATPEFKVARRRVIENTFRWLESLSESHWAK